MKNKDSPNKNQTLVAKSIREKMELIDWYICLIEQNGKTLKIAYPEKYL